MKYDIISTTVSHEDLVRLVNIFLAKGGQLIGEYTTYTHKGKRVWQQAILKPEKGDGELGTPTLFVDKEQ